MQFTKPKGGHPYGNVSSDLGTFVSDGLFASAIRLGPTVCVVCNPSHPGECVCVLVTHAWLQPALAGSWQLMGCDVLRKP